ncbi:Abi family protein [Yoonia sp. R2-816]|uniref:Abi family protein n=1 Tax=Yoonia sp. R2-816 TaxID=3342638 RepID=UPI00372B7534
MTVARPNVAARKIEEIGYERLRIYFLSFRDNSLPGKPFIPGTTYNQILRLYEGDTKIRDVCFMAVGRFELAFRNALSEVLSARFGSHPYFQDAAFRTSGHHNEAIKKTIQVFSQTKDQRARHYRVTYTEPPLPPIWIMKEFFTFGTAARFYEALANDVRKEIASEFGVSVPMVFDSWIPGFVDLRNICAHHDRLFNRHFQKQPQFYRRGNVPIAMHMTLKAQLECLDYAMDGFSSATGVVGSVQRIIDRYPEINNADLGY